jgi:hypothetical protein
MRSVVGARHRPQPAGLVRRVAGMAAVRRGG